MGVTDSLDREMPAHTLCSHCPPIHTPWAMGPRAPGVHAGCRVLRLAIKFTGSSASWERGDRHGERGSPEIRSAWAGQGGGRDQKLLGRVRDIRNQRELFPKSFLMAPPSPECSLSPDSPGGRLIPIPL